VSYILRATVLRATVLRATVLRAYTYIILQRMCVHTPRKGVGLNTCLRGVSYKKACGTQLSREPEPEISYWRVCDSGMACTVEGYVTVVWLVEGVVSTIEVGGQTAKC
jgi:hypothetical protein